MMFDESDEWGSAAAQIEEHADETKEIVPRTKAELQQQLTKAFLATRRGMLPTHAAKYYNVPYSTVYRRFKCGINAPWGSGRRPWLSAEIEQQVVEWCLSMTKIGSALTKMLLRSVVKSILDSKKVIVFPPKNLPSSSWVDKFIERHSISFVQTPDYFGHLKFEVGPQHIKEIFKHLEQFLKDEYDLDAERFLRKENASRIFNCGESGYFLDAADESSQIMVRRRLRSALKFVEEGNHMVTALSCFSANGDVFRPLIINQGKKPCAYEKYVGLDISSYNTSFSDSGWITMTLFHSWLVNQFHVELQEKNIQRPVLLFVDGHSSHISLETLKFARDNFIVMFCFPLYASHIIQPLDVAVFKPLKEAYRKVVTQTRGSIRKGDLPKKCFPYVLMKALKCCNMANNIVRGFRCTGLVPYNPSAINPDKFLLHTEEDEPDNPSAINPDNFLLDAEEDETDNLSAVNSDKFLWHGEVEYVSNKDEENRVAMQVSNAKTPADSYNEGYRAGQVNCLERFESLMPADTRQMFIERLKKGKSDENFERLYYFWLEILKTPPCPHNPYAEAAAPFPALPSASSPLSCEIPRIVSSPLHASLPTAASSAATPSHTVQPSSQVPTSYSRNFMPFISHLEQKEEAKTKSGEEIQRRKEEREFERLGKERSNRQQVESSEAENDVDTSSDIENDDRDEQLQEMSSDSDNESACGDGIPCGKCGGLNGTSRMWIGCERCPEWFHKKCVSVSLSLPDRAIQRLSFACDKHSKT